MTSSGGGLGRWSSRPAACTRDPFLGPAEDLPLADPHRSLVTFLWEDPSMAYQRPDLYRRFGPDVPRRLEISSSRLGYTATLSTMKLTEGTHFDSSDCRVFTLLTQEAPPAEPHGRPLLGGELKMDCMIQNFAVPDPQTAALNQAEDQPANAAKTAPSHLTADLKFTRCGF